MHGIVTRAHIYTPFIGVHTIACETPIGFCPKPQRVQLLWPLPRKHRPCGEAHIRTVRTRSSFSDYRRHPAQYPLARPVTSVPHFTVLIRNSVLEYLLMIENASQCGDFFGRGDKL